MRTRLLALSALLALLAASCDSGEPELSTDSTLLTGGTNAPATTTSTVGRDEDGSDGATTATLIGQAVSEYTVVERIPNENGEELRIVIPNGAYTDVDLENFMIELIESDPGIYGAEVFDDRDAADAFSVDPAQRTEEQRVLLERHHFVTLTGRERIDFNGPFAEFPGGAIGS